MSNEEREYRIAFAEVDDVLKASDTNLIEAIPKHFRKFINENRDPDYITPIDPYVSLNEQKISSKARAIIALIYRSYLASESELQYFQKRDKEEFEEEERMKRAKYDPDKIFDTIKNEVQEKEEIVSNEQMDSEVELALELIDKSFIGKLIVKIKCFFMKFKKMK